MNRRDDIRKRLNLVFQDVFMDDSIEIFDEMTAASVDAWDSLTHITLVVSVEKEFGMRLSAADVGRLKNVGAMLDLIAAKTEDR